MNVLITGGRVIDPANGVDQTQDLFIRDGKIAGFDDTTREIAVDKTLDARGAGRLPRTRRSSGSPSRTRRRT